MRTRSLAIAAALALSYSGASHAIAITPETDANTLAAAVTAGASGITVTGATLSGHVTDGGVSSGTYSNASGTYNNVPGGIVLSTGDVQDYEDGPNTTGSMGTNYGVPATAAQENLLDPITGGGFNHFDTTQLDITFDSATGEVFFFVVFGSEEYPEFVNSSYIDGFGLYLNGVNIASVAGDPVNINHPAMQALAGTELDGILAPNGNPILAFSGAANPTGNTLTFIVADTSDSSYDTTVYISSLSGQDPSVPVPEPSMLALLGAGLLGLGMSRRRSLRRA